MEEPQTPRKIISYNQGWEFAERTERSFEKNGSPTLEFALLLFCSSLFRSLLFCSFALSLFALLLFCSFTLRSFALSFFALSLFRSFALSLFALLLKIAHRATVSNSLLSLEKKIYIIPVFLTVFHCFSPFYAQERITLYKRATVSELLPSIFTKEQP